MTAFSLDIDENPRGGTCTVVFREIETVYRLHEMDFSAGDVVIDIGANVGGVCCWLARRYPNIRIYAFEPHPETFAYLERNIRANGCDNVVAFNLAVTGDGRDVTLYADTDENAGGSGEWAGGMFAGAIRVPSTTLKQIRAQHGLNRVRLLKLDCEGAEWEIIGDLDALRGVQSIRGETHTNNRLVYNEALMAQVRHVVPDVAWTHTRLPDVPAEGL